MKKNSIVSRKTLPTFLLGLATCSLISLVPLQATAKPDKITADNQLGPVEWPAPQPARDIAESREILLDPTRENDLPGSKFNQAQAFQFRNEEEIKSRLRYEAMTRRLDRIGRYRDW